ncbi:hypothetical protein BDA99DRAFT_524494, partial [Phascolomyces articulosus]
MRSIRIFQDQKNFSILLGQSLTYLDIMTYDTTFERFLCDVILDACPNLTRFRCCIYQSLIFPRSVITNMPSPVNTNDTNNSMTATTTKLSTSPSIKRIMDLYLYLPGETSENLYPILIHFTSLQHISLIFHKPDTAGHMFGWINTMFPSLQTIRFGEFVKDVPIVFPIPFSQPGRKVIEYKSNFNLLLILENMSKLLEKNHDKLNAFHLKMSHLFPGMNQLLRRFVMDLGAPHLQSLVLKNIQSRSQTSPLLKLGHILNHFPCLEQLVLSHIPFGDNDDHHSNNDDGDNNSIDHPCPTLKTVEITYCSGITASVFRMLFNKRCHRHMKLVSLIHVKNLVSNDHHELETMATKIDTLEHLVLNDQNMDNHLVKKMLTHWISKKLKRVDIYGPHKIRSPRGMIGYGKQKLPKTIVDIAPFSM